ncbi:MAG: hypothetical protein IT454_10730 [Planctomycetes bacterium]|nr:hypothetical protein [Planctomycetota bacterium]
MRRLLPLSVVFAATSSALFAQQKSEAEIRADLAFARGLADRGLVDLSEEILQKVESGELNDRLQSEVRLVRCESLVAAAQADATKREGLLKKAIEEYQFAADRGRNDAELARKANAGVVQVSSQYVRTLAAKLEDANAADAVTIKAEMERVLEAANNKVTDLIDQAEKDFSGPDVSTAAKRPLFELLLNQGDLMLQWAKIAKDSAGAKFTRSFNAYQKLSDSAEEGSPWSLRAMIGIGDNYIAQSEGAESPEASKTHREDAAAFYEFAVNFSIPADPELWAQAKNPQEGDKMTKDEIQSRFLFVQMGTPGLLRALIANGDSEKAVKTWCMHFYNTWKGEDIELEGATGYLALLEVARSLINQGGYIIPRKGGAGAKTYDWVQTYEEASKETPKGQIKTALDFAVQLAQTTASDNKGTNLQIRAQKVIGEVIARPGAKLDPAILLDAAMGEYAEQNWSNAIDGMKRVIVSLDDKDTATRQETMPKVLFHLGTSYMKLDRNLEAAAVFEHALEFWQGDPAIDPNNAAGLSKSVATLKRTIKGDAAIDALSSKADNYEKSVNAGSNRGEEIKFREAEKLYADQKFEDAKAKYASVGNAAESYEKALVNVGVCEFKLKRYDAATKIFRDYLKDFVNAAANQTIDARKLAARKSATANATFYWGLTEFNLATDGKGDWNKVLEQLSDFHVKFPEQTALAPAAMYRALIAYGRLDKQDKVKELLALMLQKFPDDRWTGNASVESYKLLKDQHTAEKDEAKKKALLREMALNLQTVNRTSQSPKFDNMRTESRHWMDLGEWATAEELLTRIVNQFAKDTKLEEDFQKYVYPDLGEALLLQHKAEAAMTALAPLMAESAKFKANRNTAYDYIRAVVGYPEWDGKKIQQHAGAGASIEDFDKAFKPLNQLVEGTEKWTKDWYQFKALQIFALTRAAQFNGKRMDDAKSAMAWMQTQLGAQQFKHENMPEETRQLFLWLAATVK